jgi:uridylate kinase
MMGSRAARAPIRRSERMICMELPKFSKGSAAAEWTVISLGGGIINPAGGTGPDVELIGKLCDAFKGAKTRIAIVTGGGKTAREYAEAARKLGAGEFDCDEIAILSTKQNAGLMLAGLRGVAFPAVLRDFREAVMHSDSWKVLVMGGTIPGITTDTDSALLAEALGAKRLVNLSNVDGIYDANPKDNPGARKFEQLGYGQLISLAANLDSRKAGENFVFDILACKIISRSNLEAHFVSGRNLDDVKKALEGKPHTGTVVK